MSSNRVFRIVLIFASVLLVSACASQPKGSLDEKYFQREANNYLKFQHEGQTVYCQNDPNASSLIPHKWCITEAALRQRVENSRVTRNAVTPWRSPVSTVPGG
jgi:outer membrane biogenesis lipoprotein LolB